MEKNRLQAWCSCSQACLRSTVLDSCLADYPLNTYYNDIWRGPRQFHKNMQYYLILDTLELVNKGRFEHARAGGLVANPENQHVGPFFNTMFVSVNSVVPTPNFAVGHPHLKNQRLLCRDQFLHFSLAMFEYSSSHSSGAGKFESYDWISRLLKFSFGLVGWWLQLLVFTRIHRLQTMQWKLVTAILLLLISNFI